jgi:hypothetical protein
LTIYSSMSAAVRGVLIYCADYRCSHSTAISGDRWPNEVRLSDVEAQFVYRRASSFRRDSILVGGTGWALLPSTFRTRTVFCREAGLLI